MHRAKLPPTLQPSYSAGKSCVARRAAQACTSLSRDLLGSLIAGTHPATLAAHTGTGMQGLEWLWTSQVNITMPGLHTELPAPAASSVTVRLLRSLSPLQLSAWGFGSPSGVSPELLCGQDSNEAHGWFINIP